MVGPGEVDGELEGEITGECSKYGKITKCLIYEVRTVTLIRNLSHVTLLKHEFHEKARIISQIHEVVAEEAVRIFLEFEKVESAIKGEYSSLYCRVLHLPLQCVHPLHFQPSSISTVASSAVVSSSSPFTILTDFMTLNLQILSCRQRDLAVMIIMYMHLLGNLF